GGDRPGYPALDTQRARDIGFHNRTLSDRQCNEMSLNVSEVQELSAYLSSASRRRPAPACDDHHRIRCRRSPEATLHALAGEILRCRDIPRLLAEAIGWAEAGALFGLFPVGPLWRPRRLSKDDVAPPVA